MHRELSFAFPAKSVSAFSPVSDSPACAAGPAHDPPEAVCHGWAERLAVVRSRMDEVTQKGNISDVNSTVSRGTHPLCDHPFLKGTRSWYMYANSFVCEMFALTL
jgi:hypothetical protein